MTRKISASVISIVLLVFIIAGLFAFTASAESELNYSYPRATKTEEVYFDELLDSLSGVSVSEVEREYLRLHSDFLLTYNYGIPTNYVTTQYDEESGELAVAASEYEYIAQNGVTVVWKPMSVSLFSEIKPLSAPEYSTTFSAESAVSGDYVTVKYKADFVIDESEVNRFLNLTYNDAVKYKAEIEEKTREYETARDAHLLQTQKYNEYIANLALYKQYLSEKRIYDEQFAEYNAYLEELAEYELQKAAYDNYEAAKEKYYEDYAKYKEYLAAATQYESQLAAYEKYTKEIEIVKAQLAIIESTKTQVTSLKRTVYGAIMGDTVTSVIANKDAIANSVTGADPATIDRAGAATESLRELLSGYFSAEGESEKYNYYITNYEGFRDNFAELLRTLDKLYMNRKVRGALISEGKQEKYLILLAQLYYVTTALSDDPVKNYDGNGYFDSKYIIGRDTNYYFDAASPAKILGNDIFVTDTNTAAPLESGYPSAVEKPAITVVEEPVMPTHVSKPSLPEPVSKPDGEEPKTVAEPTAAAKPGKAPPPYVAPSEALPIVNAYNAGALVERNEISGNLTYSPEIFVRNTFLDKKTVTVKFYGQKNISNDAELLYETEIEAGTYADYVGALPVKMEDRTHTYSHTGWVDAEGFAPDFSSITEDTVLFADFTAIEKDYKTNWIVNGVLYDECPDEPEIPPSGNNYYVFTHWEKTYALDPVTKEETIDVIWVACFEEKQYVIADSGYVEISFDGLDYVVMANGDSKMDIGALLDVAAGEGGLVICASNAAIRFSYAETLALKSAGVRSISSNSVLQTSAGGYAYSVSLYDAAGKESEHKAKLTFESYYKADDPTHLYLYAGEGEERKTVNYTLSPNEKRIKFTMTSGTQYVAREEYSIKPLSLEGVAIGLDKLVARCGDTVRVTVDKLPGIFVSRVYMKHSDGKETDIQNGVFTMPADDLSICVDFIIEEYVISFVSEGKTIVSYVCRYGDTVTPPTPPNKASDSKYKYTFVGWDGEILPATQNTTYTAIYKQELLPRDNSDQGLQITPSVLKILLFGASFALIFVFAVIPSITIFAVLSFKRRSYRIKSKKR